MKNNYEITVEDKKISLNQILEALNKKILEENKSYPDKMQWIFYSQAFKYIFRLFLKEEFFLDIEKAINYLILCKKEKMNLEK